MNQHANNYTTLVGTAIVDASGNWAVTSLTGTSVTRNAFAAEQVDAQGNQSQLSNLWTVAASNNNLLSNGDFSSGNTGFTTSSTYVTSQAIAGMATQYTIATVGPSVTDGALSVPVTTNMTSPITAYTYGTWSKQYISTTTRSPGSANPDGTMTGSVLVGQVSNAVKDFVIWSKTATVEAGKTYEFKFDYQNSEFFGTDMGVFIDGAYIQVADNKANNFESGHFTATYVATSNKSIEFKVVAQHSVSPDYGDYILDNMFFAEAAPVITLGTNTAGSGPTPNPDTLSYEKGALDALASDDVITATSASLSTVLAAGGLINGGAGVDTLKLAAGTDLDLLAMTSTQTVKPIQQIEVFQMQGNSSMTLSANDVLSLGATDLAGYSFASTTGGTASTASAGKVQMVIKATDTDKVNLSALLGDGLGSNTGALEGVWDAKGNVTIGGVVYKVYDHSTTKAQLLVNIEPSLPLSAVGFSSMTKDSGLTANADWITADGTAGRLVSGYLDAPLATGDVLKVYSNGTYLGNAKVNGTQWTFTDTAAYTANWTYSAQVESSGGVKGGLSTQVVNTDFTEAAPVITGVKDALGASVGADGATTNVNPTNAQLISISGTGSAGAKVFVYDNSSTYLVATATVDSSGNWTATNLAPTLKNNTFSAKQLDAYGNESAFSNLWTVTTNNSPLNGNFDNGDTTGFATDLKLLSSITLFNTIRGGTGFNVIDKPALVTMNTGAALSAPGALTTSATTTWGTGSDTWYQKIYASADAEDKNWSTFLNLASGKIFVASTDSTAGSRDLATIWGDTVHVVKGQQYEFHFDYWANGSNGPVNLMVNGTKVMGLTLVAAGQVYVKYTATSTGPVPIVLETYNRLTAGDIALDNMTFEPVEPVDGTLVAGGFDAGANDQPNNLSYSAGALNARGSDDVITVTDTALQATLASGAAYLSGGAGVDTLKLAANTTLNLEALTRNQTVAPIQQIEVFQLQGGSTLTLSANAVLSLGGAQASTMSAYSFSSTTGGSASASSAGKVQFVVNATGTDVVNLSALSLDAVTTDGGVGNTGMAGSWTYMGTTTANSVSYKVYNHSTSEAQVLVANASVSTTGASAAQAVSITSLTSSGAASALVEEFTTAANTTGVSTLNTSSWTITDVTIWDGGLANNNAPTAGLLLRTGAESGKASVDSLLGTDGKLQMGTADGTGFGQTYTFTSKVGDFTSMSFKSIDLANEVATNYPVIVFRDADGNVVHRQTFTAPGVATALNNFEVTLPTGVSARSFSLNTASPDRWFMDELTITPVSGATATNGGSVADSTPLISGTYASTLNAGEVIKVYDGSTYLGNATVDAANKTWTFQVTTPATVGAHSYVAKVESATAVVATSSSFGATVVTPVVLDMNGDGVMSYKQVKMDMNADGVLDTTAWVGAQDGVLVRDSFGDGTVRSTSQFAFARHSGETDLQGLAALFDTNQDKVLDAKDAQFGEFAVWQDTDEDGVADLGEVKHLIDLGITEINLVSDGVLRTPATGVTVAGHSTAVLSNGTSMLVADAAFEYHAVADAVSVIPASEPGSMDPGSSSGVTSAVIPASEPGSMSPTTPMSVVMKGANTTIDLASFIAHNGNPDVTQIDLTGTGDNTVKLSLPDVLSTAAENGAPMLIKGNAGDVVELFNQGHNPVTSTTAANGQFYTAYDLDANGSLDLLVDQAVRVGMA